LLGHPFAAGVGCAAGEVDAATGELDEESTYSLPSQSVSTVKKSQAIIVCACVLRNSRQERPARPPAGPNPCGVRKFGFVL